MKKLFTQTVAFLFVAILSFNAQSTNAQETTKTSNEKTLTATFKGLNVSDNFKFEFNNGEAIVFHDEAKSSPSKISLFDEGLIGDRFTIFYKWVDVMLFDNGVPTGETMKVKRIYNIMPANNSYQRTDVLVTSNEQ